jgi:hypothetical protein
MRIMLRPRWAAILLEGPSGPDAAGTNESSTGAVAVRWKRTATLRAAATTRSRDTTGTVG